MTRSCFSDLPNFFARLSSLRLYFGNRIVFSEKHTDIAEHKNVAIYEPKKYDVIMMLRELKDC